MLRRLAILLSLLGVATLAGAHPAPFSFLDLYLDAEGARGAIVVHDFDVAYELKIETPAALLDATIARDARDGLVALLDSRLRLRGDDSALSVAWGDIELLPERQSLRLPFALEGPVQGRIDVKALLFPYDPVHQTFVNIYEDGELRQQAILDSKRHSMRFYRGSLQGRWAVITTFVKAGVHHILIGPDHVLFLLGLMLLGGSWWRLATIVTAFTVGHSITLSLAALGIVYLAPAIVEPVIALSIIVVGVDALLVSQQRRSPATSRVASRDLRPWFAGVFGLIHGFGFAGVLIELGLPAEALGWSLAAFNIGVEIGQLSIVLCVIAAAACIRTLPAYKPVYAERFLTIAAVTVIAAGVYWLAERIGFLPAA